MSRRRYTVTQRNGAGQVITTVGYTDPKEAFASFVTALAGAGHSEHKLRLHHQTWTVLLMSGANGYEVLDPGLNGSISITISAT